MDVNGKTIMTYDFMTHDHWFALTLDPDGKSFWSADYCKSTVWKFDIETGKPISYFNTGTPPGIIFGLHPVIMSELLFEKKLAYT